MTSKARSTGPIPTRSSRPGIERPLSPHLQAYRLPYTAWLSITHRLTGVLLCAGLVALALLPIAAASGPDAYGVLHAIMSTTVAEIILWMWLFAFSFHLSHGVRHLFWDGGLGYEMSTLDHHATLEVAAALLATVAVWILGNMLG